MWWQVHKVGVASAQARTVVSCGKHEVQEVTYPRQSEPLQELAEQCKQSLRAMPQVAYANQLNEVIPQCLCRFKRSFHFQMRCAQCKEITVLHLLHGRTMEHGGLNKLIHRWFQTKAATKAGAKEWRLS